MLLSLVTTVPTLLVYEAVPIGIILMGIALLVWVLTSLGQRRSRSRRRVTLLTGGAVGGLVLVVLGFAMALSG